MKERITEEMHLEKEWFEEAKQQTVETLPAFINHIMNDYDHDYGTVCHAVAACALAGMTAADYTPGGGITGFQASFVMWDFIREVCFPNNKTGMRILNMDDMLYPQSEHKFQKSIHESVWKALQKEAAARLEEREDAHPDVRAHWQSIVDGNVPFGYTVEEE